MPLKISLSPKKRAAGRFIAQVRRDLVRIVLEAKEAYGITRSDLAREIECDKSLISKRLNGTSDLTLRSVAEIAWASKKRARIIFEDMPSQSLTKRKTETSPRPNYGTSTITTEPETSLPKKRDNSVLWSETV